MGGLLPFDHPFLAGLLGDEELAKPLGIDAEIDAMLAFEWALAEAEAELGVIPDEARRAIAAALAGFRPDMARLGRETARDGVVVPEFVRQIRIAVGEPHHGFVHFGATSQDVIDTALMLCLKPALALLDTRLASIAGLLRDLRERFGGSALMGRTRMQAAVEITVANRIDSWAAPIERHRARLRALGPTLLAVQFGGAAGTLDKLGGKGAAVRKLLAQKLGLGDASQWHSQRDSIAELAGWLSLVTGSLGKIGQDIALMAQAGGEIALSGGGGSSAMPHKQNPVGAELLVTLARFNAVQVSGMHQSLVHEQERSGAAWTLEWLILPQMLMATGASTRVAIELLGSVERLGPSRLARPSDEGRTSTSG